MPEINCHFLYYNIKNHYKHMYDCVMNDFLYKMACNLKSSVVCISRFVICTISLLWDITQGKARFYYTVTTCICKCA